MSTEDTFTTPIPHHISDVDTWGHPDRNYFFFVILTFLFGFVGLDHMYLRSNETAFKKLLLNIFGLGIWYIWDILQVLQDGPLIRKHGLNSPFDWIRGIGRGMFIPLAKDNVGPIDGGAKEKSYAAPKDYFLYTLLAITLGVFGADKFYLGNTWQGLAKVFSVFNIFLFLFGILWVVWDAVHAYFMTKSILEKDVTPPLPFSWFFSPIQANLFKVQEVKEEKKEDGGFLKSLPIPSLPILPWREMYRELVVPILQPTVGNAVNNIGKVAAVGTSIGKLGATALSTGPGIVENVANQVVQQTEENVANILQNTTIDKVQSLAAATAAQRQKGGGSGSTSTSTGGPGPILAGALTALLLAGGLKGFYDFLSKQVT